MHRDPVCGRRVNANRAYISLTHEGTLYYLCCPLCQREFEQAPEAYAAQEARPRRRRHRGA